MIWCCQKIWYYYKSLKLLLDYGIIQIKDKRINLCLLWSYYSAHLLQVILAERGVINVLSKVSELNFNDNWMYWALNKLNRYLSLLRWAHNRINYIISTCSAQVRVILLVRIISVSRKVKINRLRTRLVFGDVG